MEIVEIKSSVCTTKVIVDVAVAQLSDLVGDRKAYVVTDSKVASLYRSKLPEDYPLYEVTPGEYSKSLREATTLYRWLQDHRADRSAVIIAFGGGAVCDLAGFVAATYLRGVDLILVPTTLLAQVDASIGGKNALNLYGFKNIVGTFYPPEIIIMDYSLLSTLPEEEVKNGLAEMLKHAMIADKEMYDYLRKHVKKVLELDSSVLKELVPWSVKLKRHFVEADEFDTGERRKLNFGHTWGHAVESISRVPHGFAVSIGIAFATRLAVFLGLCSPATYDDIIETLTHYGLPTETEILPQVIIESIMRDKKRVNDDINWVLPVKIGEMVVKSIPLPTLKEYINEL